MKKGVALFALVILCFFCTSNVVFAQRGNRSQETIEVRLASSLPRNSDWGRALDRLAADWARVTNNEVRLRVIHDGVEGSEAKMLSSLSANNIQAALFVSTGLAEICPEVMSLSVPFQIKNDAELDLVLGDVLPFLDEQISKTNFAVVAWAKGGWVNVFSKDPILVPDDLRRLRLASNPEMKDMNLTFRTMGFTVVETDMVDIGTRLANNMISATYLSPAMVAPMGMHRYLKHMMHMPIAPFLGAIVVNRATWNRIGPERQQELIRVTQNIATEINVLGSRTAENAVTMMSRDGLNVNRLSQTQEALWHDEFQKAMPSLVGTTFDRDLYNQITRTLERARNGNR